MGHFANLLVLLLTVQNVRCGVDFEEHKMNKDIKEVLYSLNNVLNFVEQYYFEINMDGLLGIVLAQAQLEQTLYYENTTKYTNIILGLVDKTNNIRRQILPILPTEPSKYVLFQDVLLKSTFWYNDASLIDRRLNDFGIYNNWTVEFMMSQKRAEYNGVPTDVCLEEIMKENYGSEYRQCHISSQCQEMMLADRNDTMYLLTHRLLYLQIARQLNCAMDDTNMYKYIRYYCSQILMEAKTNEYLGFPQHDIFLEQVALCGMEGFAEFTIPRWKNAVIRWQNNNGCYKANDEVVDVERRDTNFISFGCTDHTTGLGAAALALNLRYLISNINVHVD